MTDIIDDSICPLCQQSNRCEVQASAGCWCMTTTVPAELLAKTPEKQKNKSCICQACIENYYQTFEKSVHRTTQ